MNKVKSGAYIVYWEQEGGVTMTKVISDNVPKEIKAIIAHQLLRDLNIPIRIEL